MLHKYKLRQMVRLVRAPISDNRANGSGIYEVTGLMPADETGEVSYRIKSGMTERAVREYEIRA
jgi:DNA polymerase III delta prime subunit